MNIRPEAIIISSTGNMSNHAYWLNVILILMTWRKTSAGSTGTKRRIYRNQTEDLLLNVKRTDESKAKWLYSQVKNSPGQSAALCAQNHRVQRQFRLHDLHEPFIVSLKKAHGRTQLLYVRKVRIISQRADFLE